MKKTNKKGFTLVELVIVIAVIAILTGVLIGTFASVISRANQSKAVQEWKAAIDEAYVEYVADNHTEPTSVKIDGKTVTFGSGVTLEDSFAGFQVLDQDKQITLDTLGVYFTWTIDGYTVGTTKGVEMTENLVKTYMQDVVDKALIGIDVSGNDVYYELTKNTDAFKSIRFNAVTTGLDNPYTSSASVTTAIITNNLNFELGTYNNKTWQVTFTLSDTTLTASVTTTD